MLKILQLFKVFFSREARLSYTLQEFIHQNKKLLIIVADPKTDKILVAYQDKHAYGKIKSPEGKKLTVVRDVITHSKFEGSIDQFLTGVVETMQTPVSFAGQFLHFLDGSLYNIAKALSGKKVDPDKERPAEALPSAETNK